MNLLAPLLTLETVRLNLDVVSRKRLYEEAGPPLETPPGLSPPAAFFAFSLDFPCRYQLLGFSP